MPQKEKDKKVAQLPGTPNQSSCDFLAFPKMGILLLMHALGIIGATMSNEEHLHCTRICLGACICGLGCKYKPFFHGHKCVWMHAPRPPLTSMEWAHNRYASEKPKAMVWGGVECGPDSSGKPLRSRALLSVKTRWICSYDTWWVSWGKKHKKIKSKCFEKTFFEPCNICFSKCPPFM